MLHLSILLKLYFLKADREKQAAKEKEEAERLAKEEAEKKEKEKAEKIREARVRKLSARLPPEPKEEKAEGQAVSQLRFRIPATLTRDSEEATTSAAEVTSNGETKTGKLLRSSVLVFRSCKQTVVKSYQS